MIIDKNGNQILDESAISTAAVVSELENYMMRAVTAEKEIEELLQQIGNLKEELKQKQDFIDLFSDYKYSDRSQ